MSDSARIILNSRGKQVSQPATDPDVDICAGKANGNDVSSMVQLNSPKFRMDFESVDDEPLIAPPQPVVPDRGPHGDYQFYNPQKNSAELKEIVWNDLKKRDARLQPSVRLSSFNNNHGYALQFRNEFAIDSHALPNELFHRSTGYEPFFHNPLWSGHHLDTPDEALAPPPTLYIMKMPQAPTDLPITSDEIRRGLPTWTEPGIIFLHQGPKATNCLVLHQMQRMTNRNEALDIAGVETDPESAGPLHRLDSSPCQAGSGGDDSGDTGLRDLGNEGDEPETEADGAEASRVTMAPCSPSAILKGSGASGPTTIRAPFPARTMPFTPSNVLLSPSINNVRVQLIVISNAA
ncbi:hypothetical protein H072_10570 [Dactylellina haptotyla CBS 200.50]|uniref:Uncharacterized protein n=1 Tax=Dactylellina haptotyla (strain CBS 200.50) TaxID=1284197 RepID=S7ZYW9_DACHA|nr:hypothetical protein H072_10570 [Dactylellina haptotyla CBS 200.50]